MDEPRHAGDVAGESAAVSEPWRPRVIAALNAPVSELTAPGGARP